MKFNKINFKMMIAGDSVPNRLFPHFESLSAKYGVEFINGAMETCGISPDNRGNQIENVMHFNC
jgi:hypothetical protein